MVLKSKASPAVKIWLGVLTCVLLVLFIETRTHHTKKLNFVINSASDDVGAEVLVDNQRVGTLSSSDAPGSEGEGIYVGYLSSGKHLVEIRKPGFKPYSNQIDMHQEQYLGVDLQRLSN